MAHGVAKESDTTQQLNNNNHFIVCVCVCVYRYRYRYRYHIFFLVLFYFGVYLFNNVVLVSGVQQRDSVAHIYLAILLQIIFPFRLLQSIEQSSLCYTVCSCWIYILSIIVVCSSCQSQTLNLFLPTPFSLVTINSFSKSVTLFLVCK